MRKICNFFYVKGGKILKLNCIDIILMAFFLREWEEFFFIILLVSKGGQHEYVQDKITVSLYFLELLTYTL